MGVLVEYSERRAALLEEGRFRAARAPDDAGKRPKPSLPVCVRKAASTWWRPKRVKCCVPATAWISPRIIWPLRRMKPQPCGKDRRQGRHEDIVSPDILHKTDAGGVALNIESAEAAREAFERLVANGRNYKADANIFGVMLTPMLKGGVECIIGSSCDSTFGPTVMFGLGGIFVEILKDVSFRVAPVNMPSCRRMVRKINGLAMLQGARGSKPCDLEALAEAACLISHMVDELRDIAEVDLNPVFAWEKGLAVADARIVLQAR